MKKLTLPSLAAFITGNNNRMKELKTFFLTFLLGCISYSGFAQVSVTPGSGGTNICSNLAVGGSTPAYTTLGNITVSEGTMGDFGTGTVTIGLVAPTGWQFNTSAVTFIESGPPNDFTSVITLTNGGIGVTSFILQFNIGTTSYLDNFQIVGLQVQATSTSSGAGFITTYAQGNINLSGGTDFGDLSLAQSPDVYTVSGGGSYCSGGAGEHVFLSLSQSNVNYELYNGSSPIESMPGFVGTSIDFGAQTAAGTYSVLATNATSGCASNMTGDAVITVNTAPSISVNPSSAPVCNGDNTSFSTTATGAGLTYQWQVNTGSGFTNIINGGVYSNATTSTLDITGATTAMNGYQYQCVVSGTCAPSATTNSATLTVNTSPSISSDPTNSAICNGNNTSFSTTATGAGLTYQWQVNTGSGFTNIINGGVYSNATTSTLDITGAITAMNGYEYECVVSGTCAPSATTNSATLTVNTPPSISSDPTNSIICNGNNTSFSTTATGAGLTYQWQVNTGSGFTNIINGGVYSNATTGTLDITGATTAMNTYQYQCVVSGTCAPNATTTSATLTVNASPSISSDPTNSIICNGNNTSFSTTATGLGLTYQWQVNTGSGFTNIINGGVYSNATTSTLDITGATTAMNTYQYQCVVSGTCAPSATTTAATLTVNASPSVSSDPTNSIICNGNNTSFSTTATGAGLTYQWQVNTGSGFTNIINGGVYSNATTSTLNITGATTAMNTYQYQCVVSGTCAPSATTTSATLTVNASPSISSDPTNSIICNGNNTSFSTTATGLGLTYQWQVNTGSGFTNIINGGVYSNATTSTLNITGATTAMNGYQYQCVVSGTCAPSATTTSATLTVNASPSISSDPTNSIICNGNNTSFSTIATGAGLTYQWQVNTGSGFTNIINGGVYSNATTGTLDITGAITAMNGYQYQCVVSGTCAPSATTTSATLTVNTPPSISSDPTNSIICNGNNTSFSTTATGAGLTYQWQVNTGSGFTNIINGGVYSNATTSTLNITGATTAMNTYQYQCVVSGTCAPSATTTSATLTVNASPSISSDPTNSIICNGNNTSFSTTATGLGLTYQWQVNTGSGFTNIINGGVYSNATTSTLNITGATTAMNTYQYQCVVSGTCAPSATTTSAMLTVNTNPAITASAAPNPLCVGSTLALNSSPVGGSNNYTTYAWNGPNGFTATTQNTSNFNIATTGAGMYSVTVTDSHGCMASGTTASVTVNANPTITVFANPNPICVGNPLALTSNPAGGSLTYSTFTWTGPNNFTAATQNTSVNNITMADGGVYSVTVTDNNGCKGSGTTSTVIVNVNPVITATATPTPLCVGSTLTLNSTPSGGSEVYNTYAWNGPGAFTSTIQNTTNPAITTGGAGVYSVTVTDNNGCQAMGTTAIVTVNTNPTLTTTVTPNPICVGNTLHLESTPAGGTSGFYPTFVWHGPGGFVSGGQNTTNPGITTGEAGTYSVTVTDGNGCMGSAATALVIVNTNPTITATVTPNPICAGNTLSLNSVPAGGSFIYTYAWNGPAGFTATTQTTTISAIAINGAGIYSVTVTDNNGCSGSATTASVVVNANPTITASATPNPICVGNTLNLNSTPTEGSGTSFTEFAWNGPTAYAAGTQNAARAAIATTGAGIYTVTVTDNNGCMGMGTTSSVTVNTNPTIIANAAPNPICAANTLTLTATPSGGGGGNSFVWKGPNSFTAGTQNTTVGNITTSGAGIYSITVTDINGCMGSATTASVTVNTDPVILTATATPNPICTGMTLTLNSSTSGGGGSNSFTWNGPGFTFTSGSSNTTYPNIPTGGAGVYSVIVTDINGCKGMGTTASVTVNPSPTISATATPNPICAGNTLSLNSFPGGGSGGYASFAWNGPDGFAILTQNTTISSVAVSDAGIYSVTVTDNNGCIATAATASVVVNALPATFTVTGGGSYCSGGTGVLIGLSGSQAGVSYQLYDGGTATGSPVAGTGSSISFGSFTAAGGPFTAVATNTLTVCTNNMTGSVTVTILPLPAVFNVTGGGSYCAGGTGVAIGLSGSATGFNYQLYNGATPVGSVVPGNGGVISFGLQTTAATYTVLATNAVSGCTNEMSGSASVTITPLPTVYTVSGGGTLCSGSTGYHVGLSFSDLNINYQLYNGSSAVGSPVAGTGGALDFGIFTTAGTYTVSATSTITGCSSNMSGSAMIIVDPAPLTFNVTGGGGYCVGGTGIAIGLTGSQTGFNYTLYRGSVVVSTITSVSGGVINFGLQTVAGTYTVSAANPLTACSVGMSGNTVVVVNPLPTVYNVTGGGNYCIGGTGVNIGLTGSDAGVDYQPYIGSGAIGSPVAGTGSGAFTIGVETTIGTYTVVATNTLTGCVSTMSLTATVGTNPLPNVYGVTGGGAYCAGGTGVTVGLANSTTGINYQLYNGGTAMGSAMPGTTGVAISFGLQTTAGTYTVLATDATTGCINVMSGNAIVTINPLPDPISGNAAVCAGLTTPFTDDSTGGIWSSSTSSVAAVGSASGIVSGNSAGVATISYVLPTTCFITAVITVDQTPAAITGVTHECVGSSGTLSNSLAGGTWSSSTTAILTVNSTNGRVTGASAGMGIVTYSMSTGCLATTPDTVNALPVVAAINSSTTGVCVGGTITYGDATGGGVWSSSNTSIATVSAAGHVTGVLAGAATITYIVTNASGCVSFVTLGVTVNPLPVVGAISGANTVCAHATITLSDTTSGGVWTSSNTSDASINSTSGVVTGIAQGSATISYKVTNTFGCSSTALYSMVIGDTMPSSAITPVTSATICHDNAVTLKVVSVAGASLTYQWLIGGLNISGADSATYTTLTPGFYQAIIGNGTCEETLTGTHILSPPAPVISYDSVSNTVYTGSFSTYKWFLNDSVINGDTSGTIPYLGPGVYQVVVTDVNGCSDTTSDTLKSTTGIPIQQFSKEIKVYPNPATSILYINAPEKVFVSVMSADGRVLIERREAISLNVSQLADGVYMIMIYDENNTLLKAEKFVKMQ